MLLKVVLPLIGEVALFIYGIQITSEGIQKALAQKLKIFLKKLPQTQYLVYYWDSL